MFIYTYLQDDNHCVHIMICKRTCVCVLYLYIYIYIILYYIIYIYVYVPIPTLSRVIEALHMARA